MRRLIFRNLGWKLLSILLAFLLWVAIAREPELSTSVSVPILFRNVPNDLDIASDIPDRIDLELRGPAGRLSPDGLAQTAVVLNLVNLQPGERTFTIHESNVRGLPLGVMFYRAVPSQVSLLFELLMNKDVPVQPSYSKPPPDGYVVVKYWFDPPKVTIRGPQQRVQQVDHVTTDPVDLSEVVSEARKEVHVRLPNAHVRMESRSLVTFEVRLQKIPNKEAK